MMLRFFLFTLCLAFVSTLAAASDSEKEIITSPRSLSILIVDDDKLQLMVTTHQVRKMSLEYETTDSESEEFEITTAMGNLEAQKVLEKKEFDLVVTDYNMPDGNGDVLAASLRRRGSLTPIVCCTINKEEELKRLRQLKDKVVDEFLFNAVVKKTDYKNLKLTIADTLKDSFK